MTASEIVHLAIGISGTGCGASGHASPVEKDVTCPLCLRVLWGRTDSYVHLAIQRVDGEWGTACGASGQASLKNEEVTCDFCRNMAETAENDRQESRKLHFLRRIATAVERLADQQDRHDHLRRVKRSRDRLPMIAEELRTSLQTLIYGFDAVKRGEIDVAGLSPIVEAAKGQCRTSFDSIWPGGDEEGKRKDKEEAETLLDALTKPSYQQGKAVVEEVKAGLSKSATAASCELDGGILAMQKDGDAYLIRVSKELVEKGGRFGILALKEVVRDWFRLPDPRFLIVMGQDGHPYLVRVSEGERLPHARRHRGWLAGRNDTIVELRWALERLHCPQDLAKQILDSFKGEVDDEKDEAAGA